MDPQIEQFLNSYVDKTLLGSGFITFAPKEKEEFKVKLLDYFSELVFGTLLQNLNNAQLQELQSLEDLGSSEGQKKIALMSASIPGFIFILEDRFEKVSEEIGRSGKITEPQTAPNLQS